MGPVEAIRTCFRKYTDFKGRASRSEFWWFYLFVFVIQVLSYGLIAVFGEIFGIVALIVMLVLMVPSLAAGCRRLHDRGMSGWIQLIIIIPLAFIVLFVLWALKGNEGDNKYGPSPLTR